MAEKNLKGIELGSDIYKIHYEDIVNAPVFTNSDTITWQQSGATLKGNVNVGTSVDTMVSEPQALVTNQLLTEYVELKNQPTSYIHSVTLGDERNGSYGIIKIIFINDDSTEIFMDKLKDILEEKSYESISLIPNTDDEGQCYQWIGLRNLSSTGGNLSVQIRSLNVDFTNGTVTPENLECLFGSCLDVVTPLH